MHFVSPADDIEAVSDDVSSLRIRVVFVSFEQFFYYVFLVFYLVLVEEVALVLRRRLQALDCHPSLFYYLLQILTAGRTEFSGCSHLLT